MLTAPLAVIGERLSSPIEQVCELFMSRTGFVGEFIMNESGRVNPNQGLRLAWAAGVIVAAMVVLGTPPRATAHCASGHPWNCPSHQYCQMACAYHGCNSGSCNGGGCACW